ncbi:N-6 DNA methylase [Streptomyces sp. NPDC046832]|uniref:N-6 DNA methylase n=1 Tax=Streptomyces sp. NPDC046832 TaxID=3155020 RepID=UPI0033C6F5BD
MLVQDVSRGSWNRVTEDVHHALNGEAAAKLRTLVPRQVRREAGSFFTSGGVRQSFEDLLSSHIDSSERLWFWDPTCGAGDLLLAATAHLPLGQSPAETLSLWGRRLRGQDLDDSFVGAARMRLLLTVLQRHRLEDSWAPLTERQQRNSFRHIQVGDGLEALHEAASSKRFYGHLLLNPPYGARTVGRECAWASGKTSQAAIFSSTAIDALKAGGRVVAILPDVLRSGSRYNAWRRRFEAHATVEEIAPYGLFDNHTDVDVFLISAKRKKGGHAGSVQWWPPRLANETSIGDLFHVRVGSVVDNRDPHTGIESPYLTARDLPADGEMPLPARTREFNGAKVTPPFVAIRRTSRPGQGAKGSFRGAGVLVVGNEAVAVDNHLIVASPKDGTIDKCRELIKVLGSQSSAQWLDERIRCRHLTVRVVKELPWPLEDGLF